MNIIDILFARHLSKEEPPEPFPPVIRRKTGNPVEFTDGADAPIVKCVTQIQGYQEGSGTPSSQNVRNIVAYNQTTISVGSKNKLPMMVDDIKSLNTIGTWNGLSYTLNGVTFTIVLDSDGYVDSITVNASSGASDTTFLILYRDNDHSCPYNGDYLSGCTGGSVTTYDLRLSDVTVGPSVNYNNATEISLSDTGKWVANILVRSGYRPQNLIFRPMIRKASEQDTTYRPYIPPKNSTATYSQSIYQGNADFVGKRANATWGVKDLGDLSWVGYGSGGRFYTRFSADDNVKRSPSLSIKGNYICENYNAGSQTDITDDAINGTISLDDNNPPYINILDTSCAGMSAVDFRTHVTGVKFAYELATPTTEPITPSNLPIKSLFGYNHIESSTGDMVLDYITDQYQDFVNTTETALPPTRKGGTKAMDIFATLDNPVEPDEATTKEQKETVVEEKR